MPIFIDARRFILELQLDIIILHELILPFLFSFQYCKLCHNLMIPELGADAGACRPFAFILAFPDVYLLLCATQRGYSLLFDVSFLLMIIHVRYIFPRPDFFI